MSLSNIARRRRRPAACQPHHQIPAVSTARAPGRKCNCSSPFLNTCSRHGRRHPRHSPTRGAEARLVKGASAGAVQPVRAATLAGATVCLCVPHADRPAALLRRRCWPAVTWPGRRQAARTPPSPLPLRGRRLSKAVTESACRWPHRALHRHADSFTLRLSRSRSEGEGGLAACRPHHLVPTGEVPSAERRPKASAAPRTAGWHGATCPHHQRQDRRGPERERPGA